MTTDDNLAGAAEPINVRAKLMAAASQASAATTDMIETARDGEISPVDNVGSGDTLALLVDATRLLIEATGIPETDGQVYGALVKWIEENSYGTAAIEPSSTVPAERLLAVIAELGPRAWPTNIAGAAQVPLDRLYEELADLERRNLIRFIPLGPLKGLVERV